MKKIYLLFICTLMSGFAFAQTHESDFLDGTIAIKLKSIDEAAIQTNNTRTDENILSREESLSDFPALALRLNGIANVTKLERPAYYTDKPELRKLLRLHFSNYKDIDQIVALLNKISIVEYAEKVPIYKTSYTPNDTYFSGTNKWYHDLVGSTLAWNFSLGRAEVKVAVVDNAVGSHLDYTMFKQRDVADNDNNANPPLDYNSDASWSHGTHCGGLATADINNARGIASLGAAVQLIGVKCTPNSATNSNSIYYSYDGVLWACQNGAHVVSMSYGGMSFSQAYQDLINAYPSVVFIAAAGNDNSSTIQYPGAYANVICVGSVDGNDSRSSFSNYNGGTTWVDIASPGGFTNGGLLSTVYTTGGNTYAKMGGTSMATPFSAGLVGLMLSLKSDLTRAQILNCLVSTGKVINQSIGPRINAQAAMQCVQSMLTGDPIANFYADRTDILVGDSVLFTDNSVGGGNAITTWQWTFTGGTPGTYTGKTPPPIFYNTVGTYNVALTVTNSQSSRTTTKTAYIKVNPIPYGQWLIQNTGFATASRGIGYISIVNASTVWALAYDGTPAKKTVQEFTRTTNGGTTWTPGNINLSDTSLNVAMIHGGSASTAWIAVAPGTIAGRIGGIFKTTNSGGNWTKQTTAPFTNAASFANVVHFWGLDTGFCMGDPINGEYEIYTTINGGTNWTLRPAASIPNPLSGEFGYVGGIEVVGNNVWYTTNKGRLYYSSNRGMNFVAYQTPITDFAGATASGHVSFRNATEGILVDNTGKVWKTTNSGSSWTQITITGKVFTAGLCWIEGTDVVFSTGSGGTIGAGSSYSLDAGVTWITIDAVQHLFVDFLDTQTGWSGWFNSTPTTNGMWKWKNMQNPMVPNFTANNISVCTGATVNFTDQTTGTAPTTWAWTFQGGTPGTSTVKNPSVVYNTPGTYDVTLITGDGTGTATKNKVGYIVVSAPPAAPSAISGLPNPCVGTTEIYFVSGATGVTYNWTIPSGWTGSSNTSSISTTVGATSGNISVTATNTCATSAASTFSVTPINVTGAVGNFNSNILGDSVKFTSTSTAATSWSWDFGDGGTSTLEHPGHKYTANGSYNVQLIVSNQCGIDTIIKVITITSVGLNNSTTTASKIYPNPASSKLLIELASGTSNYKGEIRVMDVTGRIVRSSQVDGNQFIIDISALDNGIYFIVMKSTNEVFRFLKE
ncbi:MAG: S8 family serine peptidase [Bacteroidota bacterium]